MGVTYIDPMENLQEGFKTLGAGLGAHRERKQNKKRIEEILSTLSPEDKAKVIGYTDPTKLTEALTENKYKDKDDKRADEEFAWKKELALKESAQKQFDSENKDLDEAYKKGQFSDPADYAAAKNDLYKRYGRGTAYELNPRYNADEAKKGGFAYKEKPVRIRPLVDVETETYEKKKGIDETYDKKKEVRSLSDKTTFEGMQQKNKVEVIKKTGEQARKTKATPTFEEDRKDKLRKNKPQSKDDLIFEQINKRLREKFGG